MPAAITVSEARRAITCHAQENFYHADTAKLFEACQSTSEKLQGMVHEVSPKTAERLETADVNFFPMIIQNWMSTFSSMPYL